MATVSPNLSLVLAEGADVVDVDQHIAANFSTLDTKWSTPGVPEVVQVGSAGSTGSSTVISRSDHVHGITTGTPSSTGTANSAGANTTVSASDHVHAIGANSVLTASILDSNVTTAKIADLNVTTAKIAASSVTIAKIDAIDAPANDEVFTYDSATGRGEWQAASALVSTAIADGSITRAKLEAIEQTPVGAIQMFGGGTLTSANARGWLLCNGQAVSRATYSDLFSVISTTFGVGDGATTFNVPNMESRFPIGKSATYALGATGGATTANLAHTHTGPNHSHTGPNHSHSGASHSHTGGSHSHSFTQATGTNVDPGGSSDNTTTNVNLAFGGGENVAPQHRHINSGATSSDNISATSTESGTTGNGGTGATSSDGTGATGSGGSAAQSILNPYLSLNYIIFAGVAS